MIQPTEPAAESSGVAQDTAPVQIPADAETTLADDSAHGSSGEAPAVSQTDDAATLSADDDLAAAGDSNGETMAEDTEPAACPTEGSESKAVPPPASQGKKVQTLLDEALDYCQVSQDFWQKGELESALEALDQAYELLLKVETYDNAKLIQQKEDIRFTISKRILEIYASRNIVVSGMHDAIPLDMNRYVEREIKLFTTGAERKFFEYALQRSGLYRPMILEKLREAGLPEELSWLPLIESGFKVNALSRARALGLWQFIPSTGYKFGLKRTLHVDERLDFVKATEAAIAYMKELHQIFGDWTTVLAAYNCGEGRVLRVIRNQNVNYLDNFWDLFERLPFETARYVPRFLATLHVVKNLEKYGFDDVKTLEPLQWETVTFQKQVHINDIARILGVDKKVIKEINPELRYDLLPPEKYDFRVPPGMAETLMAGIDKLPVSSRPRPAFVYHRIRRGETLSTIARRYGTSVRSIALANNLSKRHVIIAGKKLKIPQKGYRIKQMVAKQDEDTGASGQIVSHRVQQGDSLWNIARRYGTTVKEIQELNGLRGTKLSINQMLKISSTKEEESTQSLKTYRVRRGDSPFKIARSHQMSLDRFLRLNDLSKNSTIYPGQQVYVK